MFWRIFTLVYVAEIGDTSMFVTATLASGKSPVAVFIGKELIDCECDPQIFTQELIWRTGW